MTITPYMPVYRRSNVRITHGEGAYLIGDDGKHYLDFAAGIAVNAFGHSHPRLVEVLQNQAARLWHCSNQFMTPELETFSANLVKATFADSVFFCSSGTEAVEAGIKFMRRYHYENGQGYRHRIITFEGGFHGRTYGGISAGGNDYARVGFGQLLGGFDRVAFSDIAAVKNALGKNTAGILLEPIQGEGGVRVFDIDFLKAVRALCDAEGILLMCDEVQCGYGRPGTLFAFERAGITPDICTSAKGIGAGFPLGAVLISEKVAKAIPAGSHGGTYNNNPLAMAVGNEVLAMMQEKNFLPHVKTISEELMNGLKGLQQKYAVIKDVRGVGLMIGLEPVGDARALAAQLLEHGLTTAPTVTNVIRLVPPLNIEIGHVQEALGIIEKVLKKG
ncbi:MAG: aspartate aminotransferase family protein [Alphaproteobacteria bacterium]|nr:aspartate aminotransferase family protein [Alphaproteobacteria bacterium]